MAMMGIKGMGMRLQRLGNIKAGSKGEERKKQHGAGTYRLPQKLDHFIVTTMERDEHDNWVEDEQIMKELGKDPKEIPVFLPYHNIMQVFPHEYAWWSESKRHCHGNGEMALQTDPETGEEKQINCPCEKITEEGLCKARGILNVMLEMSGKIGGVHQFRTSSYYSCNNILASLNLIKSLTGGPHGPLAGIPLTLTIQPMIVYPRDAKGNKMKTKIFVAGLEYRADPDSQLSPIAQLQEAAKGVVQMQLGVGQNMKMLGAGEPEIIDFEVIEDAIDWHDEFIDEDAQQGKTKKAAQVDKKTTGKVTDLKEKMSKAEEKKSQKKEPHEPEQKEAQKPEGEESDNMSPPGEPTKEEVISNLRTEIFTMLESVKDQMPDSQFNKWLDWMEKNPSIDKLEEGKVRLAGIIEGIHEKDAGTKRGRPSLNDLFMKLMDKLGHAKEDEDLVTEEEYKEVFAAYDKDENQNTKWVTEQIEKWEGIIADRRSVRQEESNPGKSAGTQTSIA